MSLNASTPTNILRMPPRNAEFQEVWPYLHDGLERIMNFMPGEELSFTAYTNLYTTTYNFFTRTSDKIGFELYDNIGDHLARHLTQMRQNSESLHGVDLLRYYAEQWERYTRNASYANRVFIYLNRCWIRPIRDAEKKRDAEHERVAEQIVAEKKTVYPIYTLALMQWKQCFFMPIQQSDVKLMNALLELIIQDRDGAPIDQALVKAVVDSLVSLGLDNQDLNKECLDVYKEHFETLFIIETERYYKKESETFLAKNSISEYLRKAEDRLREEGERAGRYLHASTKAGLITLCEHVLIREHAEVLWDSFQLLLDGDKYEDLRRVYSLLSRIPEGLEPLRKRFEAHVKQAGLLAISKLVCKDEDNSAAALLEIQRKNTDIVNGCFNGDGKFSASLDEAYQELADGRVAIDAASGSSESTAEHVDISSTENDDDDAIAEEDYVVI